MQLEWLIFYLIVLKRYLSSGDLCASFGLAQSTVSNKSKQIRDLLKISQFDVNWTLPSKVEDNPLAWMISINGFIADLRHLPLEIQEEDSSEQLTLEEWQAILELKLKVCQALRKTFSAEGFNFAWNLGQNAGQTVPHFHLHVVPRKLGDTGILQYEPRVFL